MCQKNKSWEIKMEAVLLHAVPLHAAPPRAEGIPEPCSLITSPPLTSLLGFFPIGIYIPRHFRAALRLGGSLPRRLSEPRHVALLSDL